jgi:hypothetical protein
MSPDWTSISESRYSVILSGVVKSLFHHLNMIVLLHHINFSLSSRLSVFELHGYSVPLTFKCARISDLFHHYAH